MILVDVKEGIDVELKGEVMDQLLEFVMITKSLRQSLPEKVKEKLPKAFEVAMTVDDDWRLSGEIFRMIYGGVELKETVLDQLLEFSMIVQSLKESLPEEAKEELRPIFEISITEDSEEQVAEKVGKRLYEKICKRQ